MRLSLHLIFNGVLSFWKRINTDHF